MTNKLFLVFALLFGFGAFLSKNKTFQSSLIYAEAKPETVTICGTEYDLPCNVVVCQYDYQIDKTYTVGLRNSVDPVVYYEPEFVIEDRISFQAFMDYMQTYTYCVMEEESYDLHEDDALTSYFLLITEEPTSFGCAYEFDYCCLSDFDDFDGLIGIENLYGGVFKDAYLYKNTDPVIRGIDYVFITDIDNPAPESYIRSCLEAYDDTDGDITDKIILKEDKYSSYTKQINGNYSLTYQVSDEALNTTTFTVYIKVADQTAPVIKGPSNITIKMTDPINSDDIIELLTITDNSGEELDESLEIVEDTYTENSETPGRYKIVFSCVDGSGNKGYKSIAINYVDDIAPTISGANEYTKDIDAFLTVKTIMSNLVAEDNVDGEITNAITLKIDGYTENSSTPGNYAIVFSVKDNAGNESEDFTVEVIVKDGTLPIFYINSQIINISKYKKMTHDQIISFLTSTGAIDNDIKNVSFLSDEYTENANKEGKYDLSVKVTYNDDTEKIITVGINVIDDDTYSKVEAKENTDVKLSVFARIKNFVLSIAAKLSAFFNRIATWFKAIFA